MEELSAEELAFRIKIGQIKPEDVKPVKPTTKKDEE